MEKLSNLRTDYTKSTLHENTIAPNPFQQFQTWWQNAQDTQLEERNAMSLTTCNPTTLMPNTRIVLLKDFSDKGFTFFTNYQSAKAQDILQNPQVCLHFFWKELQQQIKIQGTIQKIPQQESQEYFDSRPLQSKIAAWASNQSQPIPSRQTLEDNYTSYQNQFQQNIPKPQHWGGYIVTPHLIEFWQGRPSRLHDRIVYEKTSSNEWKIYRLAP